MSYTNEVSLIFESKSENEGFARVVAASFAAQLDPTLEELEDIKTAVSEAVTNAVIHGYEGKSGKIHMKCQIEDNIYRVIVEDEGCGIKDLSKAMEPMYTSKPELERSGMGFSFMEIFMDKLEVKSEYGKGTTVFMEKKIGLETLLFGH